MVLPTDTGESGSERPKALCGERYSGCVGPTAQLLRPAGAGWRDRCTAGRCSNAVRCLCKSHLPGHTPTPGAYGADIVVGDGQPLGNPPAFGGRASASWRQRGNTSGGCREGCGETRDDAGNRGFVLTLADEGAAYPQAQGDIQHLYQFCPFSVNRHHLSGHAGKKGLREVASQCVQKAHYTAELITALPGWELLLKDRISTSLQSGLRCIGLKSKPLSWMKKLSEGFLWLRCIPYRSEWENALLFCVTEARTVSEIQHLVQVLEEVSDGRPRQFPAVNGTPVPRDAVHICCRN